MLSGRKPHCFTTLLTFLAWANVLHSAEAWYQIAGSFVQLPANAPLSYLLNLPPSARILLRALSLSSQTSASLDHIEIVPLNYSYT